MFDNDGVGPTQKMLVIDACRASLDTECDPPSLVANWDQSQEKSEDEIKMNYFGEARILLTSSHQYQFAGDGIPGQNSPFAKAFINSLSIRLETKRPFDAFCIMNDMNNYLGNKANLNNLQIHSDLNLCAYGHWGRENRFIFRRKY